MYNLSIEWTIPLLILVGLFSSIIASLIGLGGGLVAIPLIMLVIGNHSTQAKLIAYTSIATLSLFSIWKYSRYKQKPDWKSAFFILIGVLPTTIVCEIYVSSIFDKDYMKPYFHFAFAIVTLVVSTIIILKDYVKIKRIPNWALPICGAFIGILSGSFGLSGGVLFIPLLTVGLKMDLKSAVITSLSLKLVTSIANLASGIGTSQFMEFENNNVYWFAPLVIIIGSIVGSQIGPILSKPITKRQMKMLFLIVMIIIFIWEIIQGNLWLFNVW